MAKESTLREFLVKLGFKVDDKTKKNFISSVEGATTKVAKLGAAVYSAAGAVLAGTAKMSASLDSVYFSAKRTGSSVRDINAFSYAASQLGASSQEAKAEVEGLAEKIRRQPGFENFLSGMGVHTRDAKGHLRGTVDLLEQAGQHLRRMPMYEAEARASQLGISDRMLMAMRSGKFEEYTKKYQGLSKGADFKTATKNAHDFMVQTRTIMQQINVIATETAGQMSKAFGPQLKQFSEYLQKNGPKIAKEIAHWGAVIVSWAQKISHWFEKADEATNGWSTKILAAAAALRLLAKSPFSAISGGLSSIAGGAAGLSRLGALGLAGYGGYEFGSYLSKNYVEGTSGGDWLGSALAHGLAFFGDKKAQNAINLTNNAPDPTAPTPLADHNPGAANAAPLGVRAPARNGVNVQSKTDINVFGVQNPGAVADRVKEHQNDVHSSLVRNTKAVAK